MNVLHINQSDIAGGAAIAGYRLHQGLLAQNMDSRLLVSEAQTDDSHVDEISYRWLQSNLLLPFTHRLDFQFLQFTGTFDILKHDFYQAADILNFHSLHSGRFSYGAIPALTKHKPAVWTLHDMWAFTGHCSYSYDCDRWQTGCGKCPHLDSYPEIQRDTTRPIFKLKNWIYQRSDLTIVTLSHWLTEQAKNSLLNRFPIHHIPNGIDLDLYHPLDSQACRAELNIPNNKRVLMFGAQQIDDFRKGSDLLIEALSGLPDALKAQTLLMTLGSNGQSIGQAAGIETINLGYISNDALKAKAYSAADLFLFPTRADNLPLMLQESMACGTPMVSFEVGGVPDLVRPGITGYLAHPEDVVDFRQGIVQLLEDDGLRSHLKKQCRDIALQEYAIELQTQRYAELYQKILSRSAKTS
jgi:glycosyltransferase involved in cell wall biosynthesis